MNPELVQQFMEQVVQPITNILDPISKSVEPFVQDLNEKLAKLILAVKSNESVLFAVKTVQDYDWASVQWKELIIYFTIGIFVWEMFLEIRQRIALSEKKAPKALAKIIDQSTFDKAKAYNIDKWNFKLMSSIFSISQILGAIQYNFFIWLWIESAKVLKEHGGIKEPSEIVHSIAFLSALIIINNICNIPLSLYSTFIVEARHEMNKTSLGTWVKDQITTLALILGIGMPFLAGFLFTIQWAGDNFALYVWAFMCAFQLFFIMIFPTFIQPLFNKFTPLPEGSLRKKIEALAARLKFPLKKLFVVDGSKRSAHSNAYFFGFFNNKRIVIYDTLIEQSTEDEVVAVLAHELGHWYYNHVLINLITVQVQLFVIFYLFSVLIKLKALYAQFGFVSEQPIIIGFILFQFVYSPVDSVMTFFMNYLTRSKEFQADAFAKKLGYTEQLKAGLITLNKKNLTNVNPDPLFSMYHHSHPPLIQRLAALNSK